MQYKNQCLQIVVLFLVSITLGWLAPINAAQRIDLRHENISILHTLLPTKQTYKTVNTAMEPNGNTHIRMQESYAGYDVYGADFIVHVSKNSSLAKGLNATSSAMNGFIYQDLDNDLNNPPPSIFLAKNKPQRL